MLRSGWTGPDVQPAPNTINRLRNAQTTKAILMQQFYLTQNHNNFKKRDTKQMFEQMSIKANT